MLAPLPEQVDFEDYRDIGGVKLPFTIRTSGLAAFTTATRRFLEIRRNVVVDDSVFKMPVSQKKWTHYCRVAIQSRGPEHLANGFSARMYPTHRVVEHGFFFKDRDKTREFIR